MKKYKTLILDGKTVKKLIGIRDAIGAVEIAFKYFGEGKVQMPPKVYIHLDKYGGDFRAMPSYIEGIEKCGIKWVNVHPLNKKRGHLPTVMAIMILSDPANGFPLCVMDGTYLTALRTGAAGAVAAKFLARKDSRKIGLIGCGVQARMQLLAINELFDITEVKIWARDQKESLRFIKEMRRLKKLRMSIADTVEDSVFDADIAVTTTPSRKPLVDSEWIKGGTHINAIGADAKGKEELDPKILKRAKIVVDAWEQACHSGEINVPLSKGVLSKRDIYAEIGEIVAGKKKGRTKKSEVTVFDSTGLAIQDTAIADVVYRKAVKAKSGIYVNFV